VGDLGEMVTVESMPKQEGRNMIMVISPNKRYMEQLARAKAREPEQRSEPEAGSEPATEAESVPEAVATAAVPEPDEG
jgi:translation initiation factor IF-3